VAECDDQTRPGAHRGLLMGVCSVDLVGNYLAAAASMYERGRSCSCSDGGGFRHHHRLYLAVFVKPTVRLMAA